MGKHPYVGSSSRNRGPTASEINEAFMAAWDEFGDDKSTEFLISIVADRMNVDYGRVTEALAEVHRKAPR